MNNNLFTWSLPVPVEHPKRRILVEFTARFPMDWDEDSTEDEINDRINDMCQSNILELLYAWTNELHERHSCLCNENAFVRYVREV